MSDLLNGIIARSIHGHSELRPQLPSYFAGTGNAGPAPFEVPDADGSDEFGTPLMGAEAVKSGLQVEPSLATSSQTSENTLTQREVIAGQNHNSAFPTQPTLVKEQVKEHEHTVTVVRETTQPVFVHPENSRLDSDHRQKPTAEANIGEQSSPPQDRSAAPQRDYSAGVHEISTDAEHSRRSVQPVAPWPTITASAESAKTAPEAKAEQRQDYTAAVAQAILNPRAVDSTTHPQMTDQQKPMQTGQDSAAAQISITIGKLSVMPATPAPQHKAPEWSPSLSLEDYAVQRREGRR